MAAETSKQKANHPASVHFPGVLTVAMLVFIFA